MSTLPCTLVCMDTIDKAKHAANQIEVARKAMTEARAERRAAVQEARDTMTAQAVADQLGVTRQRVYQILAGKE